MNSQLSKEGGEDGLETPFHNPATAATQNEEPHGHRRTSKGSEPFEKWEREEMEKLLLQLNGQLGMYH